MQLLHPTGPARVSLQSATAQSLPSKLMVCAPRAVASQVAPHFGAAPCQDLPQRSPRRIQARAAQAAAAATSVSTGDAPWWKKGDAPNMKDVGSIQELVDELADAGDKLVIVEFFAPWCNACRALYPKLCKLMSEHVDDVLFLKVSFEANKDMCKTMGVKVLPFFHFYRGGEGRVDQFSCTVSKVQRLKDAIELYTAAFCSLEEPPGVAEFPDVHPHAHEDEQHPDADRPTCLKTMGWA